MRNIKKLFGLLLAIALVLQMFSIPVSATRDAYSIILGSSVDEKNGANIQVLPDRVGAIQPRDWVSFKAVDFGSLGPIAVEINNTAPQGSTIATIRLDKPDGPILAEIPLTFSSDWGVPKLCFTDIQTKVTGVHDIYISGNGSPLSFSSITFIEKASNVVESNYGLYSKSAAFSDLEGEDCAMAVNTLYGLGIIPVNESGLYNPNIPVSRGEFAYSIYRFFVPKADDEEEKKTINTTFTDVASDYKYAEAINYVSQNGIVNGVTETEFDPYAYITYQDALTIILRALGYKDIAEAAGGYPTGYISTAGKAKITISGVAYDEYLRRGQMALLLENVLDADYMTADSVKNGELQLEKSEGILGLTQNLYFSSGIVRATEISMINLPDSGLDKGYVNIGDEVYNVGKTNVLGLLGYECDFWYEEKDGEKTIKSIIPCVSTEYFDITSANDEIFSITDNKIKYLLKGETKEKEIEINSRTSVLYNGVALEGSLSEVVDNPTSFKGIIRLVENGDGSRVLYVEEYSDYIVESIDALAPALKGVGMSEDDVISLDSTNNFVNIFDAKSKKIKAEKLVVGSIVTVYRSKNENGPKLVRVYLSEKFVSGAVTKILDGEVYIGKQGYKMSNNYSGAIQGGQSGIFNLNIYDELVEFNISSETSAQVGLFIDYTTSDIDFDRNVKIKLIDNKGAVKIYPVADRITYNGRRFENPRDIISNIAVGENVCKGISNIPSEQAMRFKLNANGEISMLDTCDTLDGGINDTMRVLASSLSVYCPSSSNMLTSGRSMKYYLDNAADLFYYYKEVEEDKRSWIVASGSSAMPKGRTITCDLYSSTGDNFVVDIVFFQRSEGGITFGEPLIVESIAEGIDANGDDAIIVKGISGGGTLTYTISESLAPVKNIRELATGLKKGDIIRTKLLNDAILAFEYVYFNDGAKTRNIAGKDVSALINNIDNGLYSSDSEMYSVYIHGKVEEKTDQYIVIRTPEDKLELVPMPNIVTLCYDRSNGETIVAGGKNVSSIALNDEITAIYSAGKTTQVIIRDIVNDLE